MVARDASPERYRVITLSQFRYTTISSQPNPDLFTGANSGRHRNPNSGESGCSH